MQAFNLVPLREEGLMLICMNCSRIQQYALKSKVTLIEKNRT